MPKVFRFHSHVINWDWRLVVWTYPYWALAALLTSYIKAIIVINCFFQKQKNSLFSPLLPNLA